MANKEQNRGYIHIYDTYRAPHEELEADHDHCFTPEDNLIEAEFGITQDIRWTT